MKILLACFMVLLAIAPAGAQDRKPPLPDMATGGSESHPPQEAVVAEKSDQILVRNVIGQPLYGRNNERLGVVNDGFIDRTQKIVSVLIVDIETGGNSLRPVAWTSVDATDAKACER